MQVRWWDAPLVPWNSAIASRNVHFYLFTKLLFYTPSQRHHPPFLPTLPFSHISKHFRLAHIAHGTRPQLQTPPPTRTHIPNLPHCHANLAFPLFFPNVNHSPPEFSHNKNMSRYFDRELNPLTNAPTKIYTPVNSVPRYIFVPSLHLNTSCLTKTS